MEAGLLFESYLRGALNSIEFSLDGIYKNINERACQMMRTQIMLSQSLLKANLETMRDTEGHPLFSHVAGEVIVLYNCRPVIVGVSHD